MMTYSEVTQAANLVNALALSPDDSKLAVFITNHAVGDYVFSDGTRVYLLIVNAVDGSEFSAPIYLDQHNSYTANFESVDISGSGLYFDGQGTNGNVHIAFHNSYAKTTSDGATYESRMRIGKFNIDLGGMEYFKEQ